MAATKILSEAHWHELRRQHIGGSEVAALFGESTFLTAFELWHRKAGSIPTPLIDDNERVFWGQFLEPAIALGTARKTGWNIRKVHRYIAHPTVAGMGCTADYEVVSHDRGPGMLSIKNADWLVYRNWEDGEPPLAYELQLQHELACSGREWSAMAVLIGGNDLKIFEYPRRPKTIARIEAAVAAFWQSIRDGREPKVDFGRDGATIAKLYGETIAGKVVDMTGNNRLPELCAEYVAAAAIGDAADERKKAARNEILVTIGDAAKAICGNYTINAGAVAAGLDKLITPEMVGTLVKGRAGYRSVRVTLKSEKVAA